MIWFCSPASVPSIRLPLSLYPKSLVLILQLEDAGNSLNNGSPDPRSLNKGSPESTEEEDTRGGVGLYLQLTWGESSTTGIYRELYWRATLLHFNFFVPQLTLRLNKRSLERT